jgi:predicted metalloprotease with PDZ domain
MAAQRALFLARKESVAAAKISTQKQKNADNNMKILTNEESAAIQLQVTELTEQNAALVIGNTEFNSRNLVLQAENTAHVATIATQTQTIATNAIRIAELEGQVSTLEVQAANQAKFIVPPVDKIQQAFAANVMDFPDGHPDKETAKLIEQIKSEA